MVVEWVLCDIKMTPPTSTEGQYLGSTGCTACLFYCYLQALGQQRGEEACWSSLLADERCLLQIRFIAQWRTNQGHIMFFHVRIIHAHQKHPVCHTA